MSKKKGHSPGPKGDALQIDRMKEALDRKKRIAREHQAPRPERKREVKDRRRHMVSA